MKRTFATLGVMGLGLISLTAPAMAAPNQVVVCHAGGTGATVWDAIAFNVNGLSGHAGHPDDIIPPNSSIPGGLNWTNDGKITYIANCAPLPPGEEPPVYPPVEPPVEPIVVPPVEETEVIPPVEETEVIPPVQTEVIPPAVVVHSPVTTVTPTVQTPAAPAATVQTPARTGAVAVSQGTNQGFNAQTAAGGAESAPTWLAGLGVMLGAGALVAVRRRTQEQAG